MAYPCQAVQGVRWGIWQRFRQTVASGREWIGRLRQILMCMAKVLGRLTGDRWGLAPLLPKCARWKESSLPSAPQLDMMVLH